MKEVTKYLADDGLEFNDRAQCERYEAMCANVAALMSKLPAKPDLPGCSFENGGGYVQHDPAAARAVRSGLLRIANEIMPHKWFDQSIADETVHPSWAGRMIDEMDQRCLSRAWHRFMCMSADFREYGQPYFASHPEEAKDVCLATFKKG